MRWSKSSLAGGVICGCVSVMKQNGDPGIGPRIVKLSPEAPTATAKSFQSMAAIAHTEEFAVWQIQTVCKCTVFSK